MQTETVRGRLTILTDNVVSGKCEAIGEHGFSVFMETASGNYLFDTGMGKTVIHNALFYKKDLTTINKIVLSHAHHDHTGGLPEVLRAVRHKPIDTFAHPELFAYRYRKEGGKEAYGGIPFARGYLEKMGARFVFNKTYTPIEAGTFLTGEVPRHTVFEGGDMGDRFMIRDNRLVPDDIPDDQSMVVHTDRGLLIVLGCAHAGIINILTHVVKMSGVDRIFAVVGGTHIGFSGEVQLRESINALKAFDIQHLIPSHCTGFEAIVRIKQELGPIFGFSHVGFSLEF